GHPRNAHPGGVMAVGVVEAAAVADPAVVDLVVLVGGDAYELVAALPEGHVAADRALRAHRRRVAHVPGTGFEPPDPAGEGTDREEVDDVAAEVRLQGLVELARVV